MHALGKPFENFMQDPIAASVRGLQEPWLPGPCSHCKGTWQLETDGEIILKS